MTNPMHTSISVEAYTPPWIVDPSRIALGGTIDVDPASCPLANTVVKAARIYTVADDGLTKQWGPTSERSTTVLVNPPGGHGERNESMTKLWWRHAIAEWMSGRVDAMIFVAFKVDFLQTTQLDCSPGMPIPLDFPVCYPKRRVAYLTPNLPGPTPKNPHRKPTAKQRADHASTGLCTGSAPPHASALIYLPSRNETGIDRLCQAFADVGAVRWDPRHLPRRLM